MIPIETVDEHDRSVPIIDYAELNSADIKRRSKALDFLTHACQNYGFFCLVNHGMEKGVLPRLIGALSDFFDPTDMEDRKQYVKKNPTDMIKWGLNSTAEENREHLYLAVHPKFHCPTKPSHLSEAVEEYSKELKKVALGLAKAISKTLGQDEDYLEKAFGLKSGFDAFATNAYPPNFKSQGTVGLPDHTDPGVIGTIVQDINGGLQVRCPHGQWFDVDLPPNAIFVQFFDQLEILTNGKYKSCVHRVVVKENKARRISAVTVHGPSLNTVVKPAPEFVDDSHPPMYAEATYKQYLEVNGYDPIDLKSALKQFRLFN